MIRPTTLALLTSLVAVTGSGCASNEPPERAVQGAVNDGAIYAQIEAAFAHIDGDSTLHVAVAVHDGAVTLSGKARSQTIASQFEKAAHDVNGVTAVTARIAVASDIPHTSQQLSDAAVGAAVIANLAAQAGINAATIGVTAQSGAVTLRGTARTEAIKATLLAAAKSTPGVRAVIDHVTVHA